MRESNFSNPMQNKACVCISAAVYDRRAIDCSATLPLINSLNHLAYLTSTSPRIREMVCVDGGLERLIRILRQVPRSPSPPSMRGVITKEMQAVWKWSLAFQCVVNIGVRGSENIRTRVVEAGMVPVAVRVLESYLRIADAIRDEKRREAKKEEAKVRSERALEAAARRVPTAEVTTPTATSLRRGAIGGADPRPFPHPLRPATDTEAEAHASSSQAAQTNGQNMATTYPSGLLTNVSSVEDFTASASGSDGAEDAEMEGEESEMDSTHHGGAVADAGRGQTADSEDNEEEGDRATPRPPRRALAPLAAGEQRSGIPAAWQVVSDAAATATSVTPVREATVMATPRRAQNAVDSRGRVPHAPVDQTTGMHTDGTGVPAAGQGLGRAHHHHHHHHGHRERPNQVDNILHPSDMIYREEEVLLSLQLLAYLSKYGHVRTLFHCELSHINQLGELDPLSAKRFREAIPSWNPSVAPKKNVFCIAERYTLRSSRTGLSYFAANGESRIAPEIQYWAGVIMRNACRKDENQGGIRQCANMLCGKWEKTPREFAKCRRCRKAKYCSKQCQSKGWQLGHRFWCSARTEEDHAEAKEKSKEKAGEVGEEEGTTTARRDEEVTSEVVRGEGPVGMDGLSGEGQVSAPLATAASPAVQRRNVAVGTDDQGVRSSMPSQPQLPQPGHNHVSPSPLFVANRIQQRVYPTEPPTLRNTSHSSTPTPSSGAGAGGPTGQQGTSRRVVSAIPSHLQPSTSSDDGHSSSRSRTVSVASSGGEMSDLSDDEMERASRRVLANTISPAQRSPGVALTPLAAMTTADEALMSMTMTGTDEVTTTAGMVPTRTDLAGRPLPPPVIAQHDAGMGNEMNMHITPGDEILAMGGRLTPGVGEENENAVFGRGDFDQMIWRGRTPAAEEQEEQERESRRRGSTVTARSMRHHGETEDEEEEEEEGEASGPTEQPTSTSLLNSALLLAGGSSSTASTSRTMAASPRYPSPHAAALHAPVARQAHRFASVAASSSPAISSSTAPHPPHSFVRGSLAGTFGDWRVASSSPTGGEASSNSSSSISSNTRRYNTTSTAAAGLGLNPASSASSRPHPISTPGRMTSAPAFATSFATNVQGDGSGGSSSSSSLSAGDGFVVPDDIQDLLNNVDGSDEMQLDTV